MTIRKLSLLTTWIFLVSSLVCAQKYPSQALEDPLSTVLYLLSTTDKDDNESEKACLARSLASVDRYEDVQRSAQMIESDSYVEQNLVEVVGELIPRGKEKEASTLVSFLLARYANDENRLEMLIRPMIMLSRDAELDPLIAKFDDSTKIDLWFKMANIYRETGKPEKALETLKKTVAIAQASQYSSDRSGLALQYAKLGREADALQLLQGLIDDPQLKARTFRVVHDVAKTYRELGRYSEANEIHRLYDDGLNIDETRDLVSSADKHVRTGSRQAALDTLAKALTQLDPKEYGDSFNLGNIIDLYLKMDEMQKAEQVARSITGSDYMQQSKLLAVADRYANAGNKTKAREILRLALEQTHKIDTSKAESGNLWTSGKWDQARYQSQIAIRYMDLMDDKEALRITSQLRKPYLRALVLTEYVAINRSRASSKKLATYLEEAVGLLRRKKTAIFDSKRFDVYAIAARNFAEIGMVKRANEVFAETLTELDRYVIDEGELESALLFPMCNIGVEFERSKIKADENVKSSLRKIIKNWEDGEY